MAEYDLSKMTTQEIEAACRFNEAKSEHYKAALRKIIERAAAGATDEELREIARAALSQDAPDR